LWIWGEEPGFYGLKSGSFSFLWTLPLRRKLALLDFGGYIVRNFSTDGRGGGWGFPPATKYFQAHVHNPLARFFEVEKAADKCRHYGLPNQRAQARVNIGQNHHTTYNTSNHLVLELKSKIALHAFCCLPPIPAITQPGGRGWLTGKSPKL
jgi:hypothetical protein